MGQKGYCIRSTAFFCFSYFSGKASLRLAFGKRLPFAVSCAHQQAKELPLAAFRIFGTWAVLLAMLFSVILGALPRAAVFVLVQKRVVFGDFPQRLPT